MSRLRPREAACPASVPASLPGGRWVSVGGERCCPAAQAPAASASTAVPTGCILRLLCPTSTHFQVEYASGLVRVFAIRFRLFSTATVATMFILAGAHYSGLRTESVSKKWAREWATRRGPCRAQQPGRAADQVRGAHPCATLAPPLAAFISRLSLHSPVCRRCIVLAHGTDAHLPLPAF